MARTGRRPRPPGPPLPRRSAAPNHLTRSDSGWRRRSTSLDGTVPRHPQHGWAFHLGEGVEEDAESLPGLVATQEQHGRPAISGSRHSGGEPLDVDAVEQDLVLPPADLTAVSRAASDTATRTSMRRPTSRARGFKTGTHRLTPARWKVPTIGTGRDHDDRRGPWAPAAHGCGARRNHCAARTAPCARTPGAKWSRAPPTRWSAGRWVDLPRPRSRPRTVDPSSCGPMTVTSWPSLRSARDRPNT